MYRPKFQVILEIEQFYLDHFICLGSQLITIINFLQKILTSHVWYGANVVALDDFSKKNELNSYNLVLIGDDCSLIKIGSEVEQFLSGVFIAIDKHHIYKNMIVYIDTEDEQYRQLDLDGVLIEIRLVDTSFFALYSENEIIINKLSEQFKVRAIRAALL